MLFETDNLASVILINPPNDIGDLDYQEKTGEVGYPPGGLLMLGACLEQNEVAVHVVDMMDGTMSLKQLLELIKQINPTLVGITSCSPQIRGASQIAKIIKTNNEDIAICLGGAHASAYHSHLGKHEEFDIIWVGEGEKDFPPFVKAIHSSMVKGKIWTDMIENKIIHGQETTELDQLPFSARHLLTHEYYMGPYKRFSTIHSSRGCPYKCLHCSSPIERRRSYRSRSPKNVADEIEYCVKELKSEFILFTDDTFTTNRKRVVELCEIIINRGLKFKFCCETRVERVDAELLTLMKQAGLAEIQFGIESGSERIRYDVINKKFSNDKLYEVLNICSRLKLYSIGFVMMGFPTEGHLDLNKTKKVCLTLPIDVVGIHFTVIMPGSGLYDRALEEGKIDTEYWERYASGQELTQPIYIADEVSMADMEKIRSDIYRRFYFRPKFIFRRILYDLKSPKTILGDFKIALHLLFHGKTRKGRV